MIITVLSVSKFAYIASFTVNFLFIFSYYNNFLFLFEQLIYHFFKVWWTPSTFIWNSSHLFLKNTLNSLPGISSISMYLELPLLNLLFSWYHKVICESSGLLLVTKNLKSLAPLTVLANKTIYPPVICPRIVGRPAKGFFWCLKAGWTGGWIMEYIDLLLRYPGSFLHRCDGAEILSTVMNLTVESTESILNSESTAAGLVIG